MHVGHEVNTGLGVGRTHTKPSNSYRHIIGYNASHSRRLDCGELLQGIKVDFPFRRTCSSVLASEQYV